MRKKYIVADLLHHAQLPEQDELLWDDGTANPEYCLDQFPLVSKVSLSQHAVHAPFRVL